ncbi:MAG: branched-chain amino acid transport system II carrier protein [Tissierellia bacterium]|nr:branched-chain amino acid transport system II carrier protein [Tissierellia bacterium]
MDNKLNKKEFISVSLMLFAMFFGSGNLIFPPILANQAGSSMWTALIGFSLTAVVFPVLGILAIAKTDGAKNLAARVAPWFGLVFPAIIYLSIGPGIAIPRNGSLAFEMSVMPYLSQESNLVMWRFAYTLVFFLLALYLCLQPNKLVDRMGKLMTPLLLFLIVVFVAGSLVKLPVDVASPQEAYAQPFFKGFIEGYNTMDTLAAFCFGLVIASTIKGYKVKSESQVIAYASKAGLIAGSLLFLVYALIAYVGYMTSASIVDPANGGFILFEVTNRVFGGGGALVLILIFTLACLTTVVGLVTSVSQFFADLSEERISYKKWVYLFTFISFVLANFGLNSILVFSVPILVSIYPAATVLVVMALLHDKFSLSRESYKYTIYVTLFISIIQGLKVANIDLPALNSVMQRLPLYNQGLEWVLPALIVMVLANLLSKKKEEGVSYEEVN